MDRSRWLLSFALGFVVLAMSCSSKDKDQARKVVQDIESKTKDAAENAAEKTKEVAADVANKGKQVVSSTGEAITDGWITTKLKAKFADDKQLKDSKIIIETSDRVVTLKGTVAADEAKKRAVMIASGTEGVLRVVDEVVVKGK
jgi:osmotically-inducible protein OsmY